MLKIRINGADRQFDDSGNIPKTLAELLTQLNIDPVTVVAEIDGQIVERKDFNETTITDGQKIELVRFVGGG